MQSAAAVSGVATVDLAAEKGHVVVATVQPSSASGTGTVTARAVGSAAYQPVYESDGSTALTVALDGSDVSVELPVWVTHVKVTSDNSGDEFTLLCSREGPR